MRCLQCGKGIPLLKRLSGSSEFCSDAHRREYHREYSQLALGRLMQSHPGESKGEPVQAPMLAGASAHAIEEEPAATGSNGVAKPSASALAEKPRSETIPSAPAAQPNPIAKPQSPPAEPAKKAELEPTPAKPAASQPAIAKAAPIQKPAPAVLHYALATAPEFEHAFASLAPDRPSRETDILSAGLPHGQVVPWEHRVEIVDSPAHPNERKLDLREVPRATPRIALDLHVVPPEFPEMESRPLLIEAVLAEPAEAFLWTGPHSELGGESISLSDFANGQFSKSDFEAPPNGGGSAVSIDAEPLLEPQPAALESEPPPEEPKALSAESEATASVPNDRIPDPQLNPLPVSSTGIAPERAKALPVFGPAQVSSGTIQIPQPNGLPLRPVIMLVTSPPTAEIKDRKSNSLSLRPAARSSEPDPGLRQLPMQSPAGPVASRMRKFLAGLTGAAVLGGAIFFFWGKASDAGLKSPGPALVNGALGEKWIANFAPDTQRQRRVSLLRSSMDLPAYRLDFESSIQIKALGWVYRAKDSRNFYVSKIEFQKPGQNPVYALVHYAVINCVDQARVETPLHVSVPMGGHYKIRFDAVGNRFTTWVQGQRVEQWTDARLSSGGAGLYSEGAEQSILHGEFAVTPLQK